MKSLDSPHHFASAAPPVTPVWLRLIGYRLQDVRVMSDNVLKLIPVDPLYVPEASAQLEATRLLALLVPEAEDVIVTVTDQVRFNELRYVWPAGFARFVLEVRNPDGDISDNYLFLISRILKCEIR